ncbi:hypothetical protein LguiB_000588 [Lonicera macranthoides]
MEVELAVKVCVSIGLVVILGLFGWVYNELVKKPKKLRSMMKNQGISGPSPKLLVGNLMDMKKSRDDASLAKQLAPTNSPDNPVEHNCADLLFPFFNQWKRQYGEVLMFSLANTQALYVTKPELVREICTYTSLALGKPRYQEKAFGFLLGQGVITSNGPHWAHQKRIIAPELYREKVKGMIAQITESANILVNRWKNIIESTEGGTADVKIDKYMTSFSGDVISRVCFGSNYPKGEEIFSKFKALTAIASTKFFYGWIRGISHIATKKNREAWALEKEIRMLILKVVNERNEAGHKKDLLQMILQGAKNSDMNEDLIDHFIVDNCKNMYMAGYETIATAAKWCLMLLASNLEWQERVRAEILQVCKDQLPNDDMIQKMKQLTMVINESLRLYPPGPIVSREALEDMRLGNLYVPKSVVLWIVLPTLLTDPEIWGPDSYKFNPDRFANGVSGACKLPQMYIPFGGGHRACIGQNLALVELKILITLILSNFSLSLSPKYVHSPVHNVVIEPKYGVNLLLKKFET